MKIHQLALSCALMLASSCTKDDFVDVNEAPAKEPLHAISSTTTTINSSYTDESSFVSSLASHGFETPATLHLNRTATTNGYNTVYGFNIPSDRQVTGFKWNSGDQQTEDWRPQGITGFDWNGRSFLLVSWYAVGPSQIPGIENKHKGARISLVDITDMSDIKYRHILLVQDINNPFYTSSNDYTQLGVFGPVRVHAGGLAYYDEKLYVASTQLGIRVFDLNHIVEVSGDTSKSRLGEETDGTLRAFNYRYILPQTGYYNIPGAEPYSCIALGEDTSSNPRLWTGQYLKSSSSSIPKVHGFSLNSQGEIPSGTQVEVVTPKDNATGNNGPVYNMQGVYRNGATTVMTATGKSSYQGSTARFVRYHDGDANGTRYRWPHGAEDLYYDQNTGYLWNLTEYETSKYGQDNRCVFAVRYADYD
ncbi:hypothetical protein [Echinicola vietnamensis]|uniref:Lipoprotein n=1 Tax=Echinicola vietnamensis (strain DSM 17526 / LMG 23754 / KMM 6221) TaxID=926556 RepID=L0FY03_ECHVK|nr:hypothetical protein [Echinicola vietnamensis]AGA78177.1 hypothetical protein Echvi_1922 [Echinicola vietnamensis DSM 17526]